MGWSFESVTKLRSEQSARVAVCVSESGVSGASSGGTTPWTLQISLRSFPKTSARTSSSTSATSLNLRTSTPFAASLDCAPSKRARKSSARLMALMRADVIASSADAATSCAGGSAAGTPPPFPPADASEGGEVKSGAEDAAWREAARASSSSEPSALTRPAEAEAEDETEALRDRASAEDDEGVELAGAGEGKGLAVLERDRLGRPSESEDEMRLSLPLDETFGEAGGLGTGPGSVDDRSGTVSSLGEEGAEREGLRAGEAVREEAVDAERRMWVETSRMKMPMICKRISQRQSRAAQRRRDPRT